MKKLIGIAIVGSMFCTPAMAQQGTLDAILGAQGPVQGLVTTLTTANAQPLVDGLLSSTGLIQGGIAGPGTGNSLLTGLLVNQDPGQITAGLQNTVTTTLGAVLGGLTGTGDPAQLPDTLTGLLTGLVPDGGAPQLPIVGALPGLDSLPSAGGLPGADSLPTLPGLGGTGGAGLSPDQLGALTGLLGG